MSVIKRPYVILSAAMSIDGKIATKTGDPELSDEEDWRVVHKLRTEVDAILVGKGTILKDNPKLHIKYHKHNGYFRIVIDSNLSIPLNANVITYQPKLYPTIICITENVPEVRIKQYKTKGISIIKSGNSELVDIENLMPLLYKKGIKRILLEGGSTLNWSFVKKNLIDEIRLSIAPWIVGGKKAISLVEGEGFNLMKEAPRFKISNVINRNNYIVLNYKRSNK